MAQNYPPEDYETKSFYRKWLDQIISKMGSTNNPEYLDEKILERILYDKKGIKKYKLPENNISKLKIPYNHKSYMPKGKKSPDFDFDLYLKGLLQDKPISPPMQESMELKEIAEDGFLEISTARVVSDMIANAYSHLSRGDYESAKKQLGYLKSLDLIRVLDGDDNAIESAKKAIIELEEELF